MGTYRKAPDVYVSIYGDIKAETEKAILFIGEDEDGDEVTAWVPKSQVKTKLYAKDRLTVNGLLLKKWIADDKGFATHEDDLSPKELTGKVGFDRKEEEDAEENDDNVPF